VLLQGESGTGKEILARLLHDSGPRKEAPFLPLNCAALPEGLAESILFGHVRGAFTDARTDRPGLFREAGHGTVFLDEVGELSPPTQARLLRALDHREVVPVGATRAIAFHARIVAATHRDLRREVAEGRFREDLAFRLNGVTLSVPPLRERGDDVLLLAQAFLARASGGHRRFTRAAQLALRAHDWPGNVRELEHAVGSAALLADGAELDVQDLRLSRPQGPPTDGLAPLRDLEKAHIVEVLRRTKGNKSRAARLLGVDRSTLYDKIRQHGLA
jgi:DNA-binding NtrC family response regulator